MTLDEVDRKVDMAIDMLFARDAQLFNAGASEWAIAHRIAVYLERHFEGWNVDCEYNKVGFDGTTKHNAEGTYKRPDIVVHHRGMTQKEHNLMVIEVKRKNTDEDYDKLRDFTSPPCQNRRFTMQRMLFNNQLQGIIFSRTPKCKIMIH